LTTQYKRPVLTWGHQVKLISHSLATFNGQRKKLAELVVRQLAVGIHEFQKAREDLLDPPDISASDPRLGGRSVHQLVAGLQGAQYVLAAKLMHDLAEVVGNEPIVLGEGTGVDLGNLPAGHIRMKPINKSFDLEEIGERLKEVIVLFVREPRLNVDVSDQDDRGESEDFLLAPAELPVLHIALHVRNQGLGIGEVGVGDLVEDHRVTAADDTHLAGGVVDEEVGGGRPAAR